MQNILIGLSIGTVIGFSLGHALRHYFPIITSKTENRIGKIKSRADGEIDVVQAIDKENSGQKPKKRKGFLIFGRRKRNKHKQK